MAKKKKSSPDVAVGMDKDWQAEDDLRTLVRAGEIKDDKKRYNAAMKMAREKVSEMQEIAGGDVENDSD
jgi:hypothetical protein